MSAFPETKQILIIPKTFFSYFQTFPDAILCWHGEDRIVGKQANICFKGFIARTENFNFCP